MGLGQGDFGVGGGGFGGVVLGFGEGQLGCAAWCIGFWGSVGCVGPCGIGFRGCRELFGLGWADFGIGCTDFGICRAWAGWFWTWVRAWVRECVRARAWVRDVGMGHGLRWGIVSSGEGFGGVFGAWEGLRSQVLGLGGKGFGFGNGGFGGVVLGFGVTHVGFADWCVAFLG